MPELRYVCTLLGEKRLSEEFRSRATSLAEEHGVTTSTPEEKNQLGTVFEFSLSGLPKDLSDAFFNLGSDSGNDIVIQLAEHRQKRLVVFDMDSTLIQQEVIDLIAADAGVETEVAAITEAAMRGEIPFTESLDRRLALLRGIDVSIYEKVKTRITFTPGARELASALRLHGVRTAVLSGGFLPLAQWVQSELGLDYAHANVLEAEGGKLTGKTLGTVVDGARKAVLLREIAAKEEIPLENVLAIGDGSNDLPMMGVAGFGVAFNAKPKVQLEAPSRLRTGNLADILYVLGYSQNIVQ